MTLTGSEFITIIIGWLIVGHAVYQVYDSVRALKCELTNIRATLEVRIEELEKRMTAISKSNFAKIRKVESHCDSTSTRFEFFDQMFRQYIANVSANPPGSSTSPVSSDRS